MNEIRKKALYPYIILELVIFIVSYLFAVSPIKNKFDYRILSFIGLLLNIPFTIIMEKKDRKSLILSLIQTITIFLSFGMLIFVSSPIPFEILLLLSISVISLRIPLCSSTLENNKILGFILSSISLALYLSLRFLGIINRNLIITLALGILTIYILIFSILEYKNGPTLEKPNWFFLASGAVIFLVYIVSSLYGPLMDDTAQLKPMIEFASVILITPSTVMITISSMTFQPREA